MKSKNWINLEKNIVEKSEFSDYGDYVLDFQYWQKTEPIDVFDRLKCMKK